MNDLTCIQTNHIYYIEQLLNIKFEGTTNEAATQFIRDNYDKAVLKYEQNKSKYKSLVGE